jgi:hypothetical protein
MPMLPIPDIRTDQVRLFIDKFREKRQTKAQQELAAYTVSFYFEFQLKPDNETYQNLCLAYLQVISRHPRMLLSGIQCSLGNPWIPAQKHCGNDAL